ncbi:Phorbol-ester/DAG-type domain-containing protein [Psidium guajava]|nr:Phorbol-ester/DAG-type domain-containing protein [Psidium guajava]
MLKQVQARSAILSPRPTPESQDSSSASGRNFKNGYIVIKGRPCKVVELSTSETRKHGHAKCHFVAIDIFNGTKLEDTVLSPHNCDVPHVTCTNYQLDISEDEFIKEWI